MQFQADLLGIPVVRPRITETTALGAASLAGLAIGVYAGLDELSSQWQEDRRFVPAMSRTDAAARMAQWQHAVLQTTLR
jgi:glycerol kinase